MKIAILGTRGIPAKYGGFETFAEKVGEIMASRGHSVTVYGRKSYYAPEQRNHTCKGVRTIYLPALRIRQAETVSHSFLSLLHIIFKNPVDAVIVCNVANGAVIPLLRLFCKKVLINVDGLEWERKKWNTLSRMLFKFSARLCLIFGGRDLVADSMAIRDYYEKHFNRSPVYISYGADIIRSADLLHAQQVLADMDLKPGEYFLQITRMVPENNTLLIAQAFKKVKTDKKLVLVGGDTYATDYLEQIKTAARGDSRIIMPGFMYDSNTVNVLLYHAYAYIHGNEVGGTNPALLQAMAASGLVLAVDTVFNREVLKTAGFLFTDSQVALQQKIEKVLTLGRHEAEKKRKAAEQIIRECYNWPDIAGRYLENLAEK